MPFPTTPATQQAIVKQAFYDQVASAQNERVYPKISMEIPQPDKTTTYTSFGSVPEPHRISEDAGGGSGRSMALKDYDVVNTLIEWSDSVSMPRSVLEDNPAESARISRTLAQKAVVFLDREAITQLDATTSGYDDVALFNSAHAESGASQNNTSTSAIVLASNPTAVEAEPAIITAINALLGVTDDQSTPVNDGTSRFTVLIPTGMSVRFNLVLNPELKDQAIDSSGVTGALRGMFDIVVSAFTPIDRFYVFANTPLTSALAYYTKTPWDFNSNIGTASDLWTQGRLAVLNGFSRWSFGPWDWKVAHRHIFTTI